MNIKNICFYLSLLVFPCSLIASEIVDTNYLQNQQSDELSNVFADIYEKLDNVNWNGKNVDVAIESLEHLNNKAHIAATDDRIIVVWGDELIGNYPRPQNKYWKEYGQLTNNIINNFKEHDSILRKLSKEELYQIVINALLVDIDGSGSYISSKNASNYNNAKILTSIGLDGGRDSKGNFRITGVFQGSPADIAGINENDLISEINGQRVSKLSDSDIFNILNGVNSETFKLKVLTPFGNKRVTLRRASVVLADADVIYHSIANEKDKGILEIIIHNLSNNAVNIVNEALNKHSNINGVLLDLRTASGNDETSAAKLAGLFIGQKPIMRVYSTAIEEIEIVPGNDSIVDLPTVVLVSEFTRGTPEVIASAFYENKKGLLIGTPSAGVVKVSTHIDLKNGDILELFNKSIKTGNGNIIDGRGVFPLVCLSNIKSTSQQEAFFLNVMNGEFNAYDYNKDKEVDSKMLKKACPAIIDGKMEDNMAVSVGIKVLTDKSLYDNLMNI